MSAGTYFASVAIEMYLEPASMTTSLLVIARTVSSAVAPSLKATLIFEPRWTPCALANFSCTDIESGL